MLRDDLPDAVQPIHCHLTLQSALASQGNLISEVMREISDKHFARPQFACPGEGKLAPPIRCKGSERVTWALASPTTHGLVTQEQAEVPTDNK